MYITYNMASVHLIVGVAWLAVSERRHPGGQLRVDAVLSAGVDLPKAAKEDGAKALAMQRVAAYRSSS